MLGWMVPQPIHLQGVVSTWTIRHLSGSWARRLEGVPSSMLLGYLPGPSRSEGQQQGVQVQLGPALVL